MGATNTGLVNLPAAAVPILVSATAVGLLLTTIWSAALRQNVNATIYGTFFGFYGSYAALSLGLTHNWFGIPPADAQQTTTLWLASWLFTIGLLTVLVLRLPWIYPAVLAIVDVALVLLIPATTGPTPDSRMPAAGWCSSSPLSSCTSTSRRSGRNRRHRTTSGPPAHPLNLARREDVSRIVTWRRQRRGWPA